MGESHWRQLILQIATPEIRRSTTSSLMCFALLHIPLFTIIIGNTIPTNVSPTELEYPQRPSISTY
jgi:hypothetical protein